jgi:hypothetical protein
MGIKQPPKQKCLPEEYGFMEQIIGITSRCHYTYNDLYGAGECLETWAKPNMLSNPPPATVPT